VGAGTLGAIYAVKPEWIVTTQRQLEPAPTPTPSPTPAPPLPRPRTEPLPPVPLDPSIVQAMVDPFLETFACAGLSANLSRTSPDSFVVTVAGHVGSEGDRQRIDTELSKLDHVRQVVNQTRVEAWPFCQALSVLQPHMAPDAAHAPLIQLDRPGQAYHEGDPLVVKVAASPNFDGYLYVDYLDAEGNLVHLLPIPIRRDNRVGAGEQIVLGSPSAEVAVPNVRYYEIQPPFGRNMLIAISSPRPLFEKLRTEEETADPYLDELRIRLTVQAAEGTSERPVAAYDFFTTAPHE
jgi:hypothetical protein